MQFAATRGHLDEHLKGLVSIWALVLKEGCIILVKYVRARKMAQCLKALATLLETGSIPSTHIAAHYCR